MTEHHALVTQASANQATSEAAVKIATDLIQIGNPVGQTKKRQIVLPTANLAGRLHPRIRASSDKNFGERRSVDNLNLSVHPGELYALLGDTERPKQPRSACHTLLRPTVGTIYICGF